MAEMLLINPRKRGRRKARSPAQKAATRKLVARNRRRSPVRARRRPAKRRIRRRNPSNAFGVPSYKRRKRNPAARRGGRGIINQTLMPAVMGAGGALVLDVAWGYLPIPLTLKTGVLRHVAKGAGALALGYLANMVATKSTADQMVRGAMTVVVHGAMREAAQQFMPNVPLDGLGYYSAGMPAGVGAYVDGMGAYVGGDINPYLAADTLHQPFKGPSAANMAQSSCIENESNMSGYYSD